MATTPRRYRRTYVEYEDRDVELLTYGITYLSISDLIVSIIEVYQV